MHYLAHALIRHWVLVIQKARLASIGVGREGRGDIGPPWNLKLLAKKVVFLVLSGKKNFYHF